MVVVGCLSGVCSGVATMHIAGACHMDWSGTGPSAMWSCRCTHTHPAHAHTQDRLAHATSYKQVTTMPRVTFNETPIRKKTRPGTPRPRTRPRKSILKKKHPLAGLVPRKQIKKWRKEVCGDFEMFFYENQSVMTKGGEILCVSVAEQTGSLLSI